MRFFCRPYHSVQKAASSEAMDRLVSHARRFVDYLHHHHIVQRQEQSEHRALGNGTVYRPVRKEALCIKHFSPLEFAHWRGVAVPCAQDTTHAGQDTCTATNKGVAWVRQALLLFLRVGQSGAQGSALQGGVHGPSPRGRQLTRICSSSKMTSRGVLSTTSGIFSLGDAPPGALLLPLLFTPSWPSLALQDGATPSDRDLLC